MKAQLEKEKRGDAIAHAPEFEVTDKPRVTGLPRKPFNPLSDDVPF